MLAMTRSRPPHRRQISMSMANTRLRRWAQDIPWVKLIADINEAVTGEPHSEALCDVLDGVNGKAMQEWAETELARIKKNMEMDREKEEKEQYELREAILLDIQAIWDGEAYMVAPGILIIGAPLVTGFLFGIEATAGLLAGSLVAGGVLAISASNSGGAWDNAKKHIEAGNLGGKGTEVHKAAVVGDTVGDPLKDTSGPSLNILIKLSAILSLVFVPFFVQYGSILLKFM
jgi:hypothetical protein